MTRKLLAVSSMFVVLGACTTEKVQNQRLRPLPPDTADAAADASVADAVAGPSDAGAAVDAARDASDGAVMETYVSDLAYVVVANGFGPAEKDMSNGEDQPNDGTMMMIGGVAYNKGLGVHAASEINVPLNGQYKTFLADVGIDDEVMDNGSVTFKVLVDGQQVFDSGTVTGADMAKPVNVDVTGKNELKLVVEDGGDPSFDHADWANARVRR